MNYHREQELLAMGDSSTRKDEAAAQAVGASPTNNPASLLSEPDYHDPRVRMTAEDNAQIASMRSHAAPDDDQDGGGYTREELVEVMAKAIVDGSGYGSDSPAYEACVRGASSDASAALSTLEAIGAVKIKGGE